MRSLFHVAAAGVLRESNMDAERNAGSGGNFDVLASHIVPFWCSGEEAGMREQVEFNGYPTEDNAVQTGTDVPSRFRRAKGMPSACTSSGHSIGSRAGCFLNLRLSGHARRPGLAGGG